jgi:multidrug efflux pump subunit AcrB
MPNADLRIFGPGLPQMDLTFMSVFGVVALSGVVVNDSLILIDRVNRFRTEDGMGVVNAITRGAQMRFRPIVLTTLTTFLALAPAATGIVEDLRVLVRPAFPKASRLEAA